VTEDDEKTLAEQASEWRDRPKRGEHGYQDPHLPAPDRNAEMWDAFRHAQEKP
jgi:hypothetical protein